MGAKDAYVNNISGAGAIYLFDFNGSTPNQNGTTTLTGSGANNFRIMQNMGYNGVYWNSSTETGTGTSYEQANANFYWSNTKFYGYFLEICKF